MMETLRPAISALGTTRFHGALLRVVNEIVPGDMGEAYYYRNDDSSTCLWEFGNPSGLTDLYASRYSECCPFVRDWKLGHRPGVRSLKQVTGLHGKAVHRHAFPLFSEQYAELGLTDEVGMFLPSPTRRSIGVFVQRQRVIDDDEVNRLSACFPDLLQLHRTNNRLMYQLLATGMSRLGETVPLAIYEKCGTAVFANREWRRSVAGELTPGALVEIVEAASRDRVVAVGDGNLRVMALGDDFPIAPGGVCLVAGLYPESGFAGDDDPASCFLEKELSSREREIVLLIMDGYGNWKISEKLGISYNTTRTHRKRIYEKLDITTEREIFLMYLEHLQAAGFQARLPVLA